MPNLSLLVPKLWSIEDLTYGLGVDLVAVRTIFSPILELYHPPFLRAFFDQDAAGLFWSKFNSDRQDGVNRRRFAGVDQIRQQRR